MRLSNGWGSARASRAGFGALAETTIFFNSENGFRQKKNHAGRMCSPEITKANEH